MAVDFLLCHNAICFALHNCYSTSNNPTPEQLALHLMHVHFQAYYLLLLVPEASNLISAIASNRIERVKFDCTKQTSVNGSYEQ